MAKFSDKISTILHSQLPEFVIAQHPKFAEFLKVYYLLLESAELSVTSVKSTEGILLETETAQANNLVLDASAIGTARTPLDIGDKIIFEIYSGTEYGKFTRGEIITGQTSNAIATVLTEDLDTGRLFISAQNKFIKGEIVVGGTSNAYATIDSYKPNPVNNISDLIHFRDPDNVINNFLSNFRDEFLATLPDTLANDVNKRSLIKNVNSLYRSKGTNKGHEIFFRILFNEEAQIFYPREQLLRVSDGKFDTLKVLRVIPDIGDTTQLIGRTITGSTSGAYAIVENVATYQIGIDTVSEFILNNDSLQGTFLVGEQVQGTASDTDDWYIKAIITGIPGTKAIQNDGTLNTTADTVSLVAGGTGAVFSIDETGTGGITEIVIDNPGVNYQVGDVLNFDNSGTGGSNASGFVKIINGGISNEDDTGNKITLEEGTMSADPYFGNVIMQESGSGNGTIEDLFLILNGSGYFILPSVTVNSNTGTTATVRAWGDEIGRITKLKTIELGKKYELTPTPPQLGFYNSCIITTVAGSFVPNTTITSSSSGNGVIDTFDVAKGLLRIKTVIGTFADGDTVTSQSGGTGTIKKVDTSIASINVVSVSDTDGNFINEDGKISETTMRIQDSKYYQDFSYVLKVARSISVWRDAFKKTMHTAGFYFTGQVDIASRIDARGILPIVGAISGREVEIPIFAILNTLFSTIFGRRLGTVDDGTTLRPYAHEGGTIYAQENSLEHFAANQRDITLIRPGLSITYTSRKRSYIDGVFVKRGWAYAGPRWNNLNKWANTIFGASTAGHGIVFKTLEDLKVFGTNSSLNGRLGIFLMTSDEDGKTVKMNFAMPSHITYARSLFSNTISEFSSTSTTFDNAST